MITLAITEFGSLLIEEIAKAFFKRIFYKNIIGRKVW
jgi:hypothetical protein